MSLSATRRRTTKTARLAIACSRPNSALYARSFAVSYTYPTLSTSHLISGHYRLSSSLPPASPDQSKLASKPIPPTPPTITAVKKPKVELRPAPVKPNPSDVFPKSAPSVPPTPRPATTANASDNGGQASSSNTKAEKIPHREGVIESAQHDFESASSHGILAPPPPGANKLQKLIHQAKEFFVCIHSNLHSAHLP